VHRIGLGPLSVEHIPRGRYRLLENRELEALSRASKAPARKKPR
jgi:16S rRNA U516 pseudouridylate synthase RsuA-like enzyme